MELKTMDQVECVVIGAGVVGLAVARALALQGREVIIVERNGAIGEETSSRHSEVIHAGIYYPEGSNKARFCVEGKNKLYDYLSTRGVAHRRIGKLIVATD
ncbi:MAG: FAD-dependent oxidoreductase, partial [Pseudomonadota bacterium]|nr:FAD-dependent oxidoreductase [Pseudomonadota bacterium]